MDIIIKVSSARFSKLAQEFGGTQGSHTLGKSRLPEDVGAGDTAWFLTKTRGTWVFAAWATITRIEDARGRAPARFEWGEDAGLVPEAARIPSCFVPSGARSWDTACAEVTADFIRVLEDLEAERRGLEADYQEAVEQGAMLEALEYAADLGKEHYHRHLVLMAHEVCPACLGEDVSGSGSRVRGGRVEEVEWDCGLCHGEGHVDVKRAAMERDAQRSSRVGSY